jgi:hypothetical protein
LALWSAAQFSAANGPRSDQQSAFSFCIDADNLVGIALRRESLSSSLIPSF